MKKPGVQWVPQLEKSLVRVGALETYWESTTEFKETGFFFGARAGLKGTNIGF